MVSLLVFLFSPSFSPLPLPLCVGVRGSARAARRARTLSPNTIVFSSLYSPPFFIIRLSCYCGMAAGDSPCVGVLCWHDCDGESVSFVLVFLIVACSPLAVSSVAASAVAFGAEDSPVVRMVGST